MKKRFIPMLLLMAALLCSCGGKTEKKAVYYSVTDENGQEFTIDGEKAITEIDALISGAAGGKEITLPKGAALGCVYVCMQEKTETVLQEGESDWEEIYRVNIYPAAKCLEIQYSPDTVKGTRLPDEMLRFCYGLTEDAAEKLSSPADFVKEDSE